MSATLLVKQRPCRSWLNRETSPAISATLAQRLLDRCRGESDVLMLTLSYERSAWQWDPERLFHAASDEQHVPLFFRRLQKYLGCSLKGRWLCKQEFQRGGWVHWHIILIGVPFIPHEDLTRLWGHGHVWINKAKRRRLRYVCKYASKDADIPAWLYAQRPRAVKIIRVSPGFWHRDAIVSALHSPPDSSAADPAEECSPGDLLPPGDPSSMFPLDDDSSPLPARPAFQEEVGGAASDGPCPVVLTCFYRSIGDCIEQHKGRVVVRAQRGRFAVTLHVQPVLLLLHFLQRGCTLGPGPHGWLVLNGADRQMVEEAAAVASREAAAAALHLTQVPNPDRWYPPPWVNEVIRQSINEEEREWRAAA